MMYINIHLVFLPASPIALPAMTAVGATITVQEYHLVFLYMNYMFHTTYDMYVYVYDIMYIIYMYMIYRERERERETPDNTFS
jgi:hypothetical protein